LHGFRAFSVLCKVFSSGALLHIRQKDRRPTPFIYDRRTKEHDTHPQPLPKGGELTPTPLFMTEGQKDMIPTPNPSPREGN